MKLSIGSLSSPSWREKGYALPRFDVAKVRGKTGEAPVWLHFGAGNIFRMYPAVLMQDALDEGAADRGVIVCEAYDEEIVEKAFDGYDALSVAVTLRTDGRMEKKVVASVTEALAASRDRERLLAIADAPSLRMMSFTITEKGYLISDPVKSDYAAGPDIAKTRSLIGMVAALLHRRYTGCGAPVALVSMDNCSHNGDRLFEAVRSVALEWEARGFTDKGFTEYVLNPAKVSFPISMIDKITPGPSEAVLRILEADGVEGLKIHKTLKNTVIAAFVNGEASEYLIIEDLFPNGRPDISAIFTDRETVDKAEKMKLCTCLNPLHTVLGVFGSLLGYTTIYESAKDADLKRLIEKIGYDEGLPVVTDPGIVDPVAFIDEVVNVRFPNPFIPDAPYRINTDASAKIPIRFGETLKAYAARNMDASDLTGIPLFFAGWLRYLLGLDDSGEALTIAPDPMLEVLKERMRGLEMGCGETAADILKPILSDAKIFGVNLYDAGLADKVIKYFIKFTQGSGAVRRELINA